MPSTEIKKWLQSPATFREEITQWFQTNLLPEAADAINARFSPRRLSKQSRTVEPLPTDQRQLSSYRTRLGTMLEYGLSTEIERLLAAAFGDDFYLTFAVAHEFPDFYLRDVARKPVLKIEMKAVDADSDEQAARFDVLTERLDEHRDFLLFIGWKWEEQGEEESRWECPQIFSWAFVPAIEIARIRDERLYATGGKIQDGGVWVPSTKHKGTFVPDPGNYGKLWRIVQKDRRHDPALSVHVRDFVRFLSDVDAHSPRKRMS